jgi:hypothetical protein
MKYEDLTGNLKTLFDFHFNKGTITISDGTYTLQEILDKNDDWWDSEHDFIQYVYPTDEPSKFNDNAPILTKEFNKFFIESLDAGINPRLFERFRNFIENTNCLELPFNHNYLRFSRVFRFIALVCSKELSLFLLETYINKYHLLKSDKIQSLHIWLDSTQAECK